MCFLWWRQLPPGLQSIWRPGGQLPSSKREKLPGDGWEELLESVECFYSALLGLWMWCAVPSFLVVMFDFPVHPNSASIGFELDVDRNNVAVSARWLLPCRAICRHAITGEFFCWVKVVMSPWEGRGTSCFFFFAKNRGAPVVWLRKASGINFMRMCVAVKTFHLGVAAVFLGIFPSQRGILIWWGDAVNSQTFVLTVGWFLLHRDGCWRVASVAASCPERDFVVACRSRTWSFHCPSTYRDLERSWRIMRCRHVSTVPTSKLSAFCCSPAVSAELLSTAPRTWVLGQKLQEKPKLQLMILPQLVIAPRNEISLNTQRGGLQNEENLKLFSSLDTSNWMTGTGNLTARFPGQFALFLRTVVLSSIWV